MSTMPMRSTSWGWLVVAGLFGLLPAANADNTAGVFGPVVNDGHRSAQYRVAYETEDHLFAQRLQYQHAIDGSRMWRAILQLRKTVDSNVDADFVQAELFWQLSDLSASWRHGLRFDLRVRTEGRPGLVGVNWTNEIDISERWVARAVLLTGTEIGAGASGELGIQSRARLMYRLGGGAMVGLEAFSAYGAIDAVPTFEEQRHVLGPALAANLGAGWQVFASALVGLTDASPEAQLRFWIGRRF